MNAPATTSMPRALPAEHRQQLMRIAREVSFPQSTRLFEEGGRAERFWIIRTGTVDLDMRVPGRRAAVIESLGHNELVGWSWLFPRTPGTSAPRRLRRCGRTSSTPPPCGTCAGRIPRSAGASPGGWARSWPTASRRPASGCWTCMPLTAAGACGERVPAHRE